MRDLHTFQKSCSIKREVGRDQFLKNPDLTGNGERHDAF